MQDQEEGCDRGGTKVSAGDGERAREAEDAESERRVLAGQEEHTHDAQRQTQQNRDAETRDEVHLLPARSRARQRSKRGRR